MNKCRNCGGDICYNGRNWNHVPPFAGGSGALKNEKGKRCQKPEPAGNHCLVDQCWAKAHEVKFSNTSVFLCGAHEKQLREKGLHVATTKLSAILPKKRRPEP